PVVAGWMVLGGRPPVFRGAASALVVAVLGAALVMVPMAVREQAAVRRGAGSSLWGIHFYIGTNAAADGAYTPVPGVRDDIVGHVAAVRQGRRAALLPLFTAGTMISLLIFFVEGRYRLPLVPPMVILAAAGIDRLAAACHRGRWLAVATGGAIVLTGAVAFAADNREAWLLLVLVLL